MALDNICSMSMEYECQNSAYTGKNYKLIQNALDGTEWQSAYLSWDSLKCIGVEL